MGTKIQLRDDWAIIQLFDLLDSDNIVLSADIYDRIISTGTYMEANPGDGIMYFSASGEIWRDQGMTLMPPSSCRAAGACECHALFFTRIMRITTND